MRKLRLKLGVWLLKPYLREKFKAADQALEAETEHDTRRGGYRQGVWSALSNLIRLR